MFRLFKALPLTLALGSLCLFAASCGSSSQSQARAVYAVSDGPALDIDVNTTKVATGVTANSFQPTPPAYVKVPSGNVTLQAYNTGTTTSIVGANGVGTTLSGSSQYTVLLTGFLNGAGNASPTFWTITDNNTAPTAGNVEFRIIDGATNSLQLSGGLDIYIVPPGTNIQNATPQVQGLTLGQASSYQSLNVASNGYEVIVTPHGNQNEIFNNNYSLTAGQIRTLVIVDSGNVISNFLELNDLN